MAETSYPLQVTLGLVDKLTGPWSETLEHLAKSQNRFVALGGKVGGFLFEQIREVGREAFHSGEELEESINSVRAASNASAEEMSSRREDLARIGRETRAGTHAAAAAVDTLAHSGQNLADSFLLATPALELANVAHLDVAASARMLDRTLDAFGDSASKGAESADLLARASLALGEPIPAVADALSNLGATARILKIPLSTVVDMLLAVHQKGETAATAANQVRAALTQLNKHGHTDAEGVLDVGKALDFLHEKGITGKQALEELGQRGGRGLAELLDQGSAGLRAQGDALEHVNSLQEQHNLLNEGLVGSQKDLTAAWQNFLDTIGNEEVLENAAKVVGVLAVAVEKLADGFNGLFKLEKNLEGPLAKFLYEWRYGGTVVTEPSNPKVKALMDAADRKYGPVDWTKSAAAMRDRPGEGLGAKKAEVNIRLHGFPKGTTVEQRGDVDVTTDLGMAIPSAGGGH